MDFLGVLDSGEWGDSSDAKDLHSKLFSPQLGAAESSPKSKKSQAARKKKQSAGEVRKKQSIDSDTMKRRKKQTSDKDKETSSGGTSAARGSVTTKKKKKRNLDTRESEVPLKTQPGSVDKHTDTGTASVNCDIVNTKTNKKRKWDACESEVPVKKRPASMDKNNDTSGTLADRKNVRKRQKRTRDTSESGLPVKKEKASQALKSTATSLTQGEQILEPSSQQEDGNIGKDTTINVYPKKKTRKRKPRNNKFKTAEFGYVAKLNESQIPNQTGTSFPQTSESEGEVTKDSKKRTTKTKAETAAKTRSNQRSKNNPDRKKDVSKKGAPFLSCPGDKGKMEATKTLDQHGKTMNGKSKEKTKPNINKTNARIDAKLSTEEMRPLDRQHKLATSATECEMGDSSPLAIGEEGDISEEHLADTAAKQALRAKMEARLQSAHFRFLSERLYKATGSEARRMMGSDGEAFDIYHRGFAQQVKQWPVNPVDQLIEELKSRPHNLTVGDFGCGEARIAQSVSQTVHSFDLCALNDHVTACDMVKVPLKRSSLDVAIFCLSLMGTNWISYLKEANRVLKMKGQLKIVEVASRFASVAEFLKIMKQLGFKKESKDFSNKMFLMFDFTKEASPRSVKLERGEVLKPCLYKRR